MQMEVEMHIIPCCMLTLLLTAIGVYVPHSWFSIPNEKKEACGFPNTQPQSKIGKNQTQVLIVWLKVSMIIQTNSHDFVVQVQFTIRFPD